MSTRLRTWPRYRPFERVLGLITCAAMIGSGLYWAEMILREDVLSCSASVDGVARCQWTRNHLGLESAPTAPRAVVGVEVRRHGRGRALRLSFADGTSMRRRVVGPSVGRLPDVAEQIRAHLASGSSPARFVVTNGGPSLVLLLPLLIVLGGGASIPHWFQTLSLERKGGVRARVGRAPFKPREVHFPNERQIDVLLEERHGKWKPRYEPVLHDGERVWSSGVVTDHARALTLKSEISSFLGR